MSKVLIVSRYFPPLSSAGGSIRLVKFIKYLANWNWQSVVFTQDIQRTVVPERALSGFLLAELPPATVVERVAAPFSIDSSRIMEANTNRLVRRIFQRIFGDSSLVWALRVAWYGLLELRTTKFDLVFGVTPPFTNALAAMLLAWLGRMPLVLDLKDDWVDSPAFLQKSSMRQRVERLLESLVMRRASAIITVTPQSFALYKNRYAFLRQPDKFHLIPNGCDLDEYDPLRTRERTLVSDRFLILSGAWGFRKDYRDISPFLRALNTFLERRTDAKEKVQVVLLGESLSSEYKALLSSLSLDNIVQSIGAVQRAELVEWLWKADLFLLVQPIHNTTAISGTLYEYWATGKAPILLVSEDGASSALVEDNELGRHFHFDEIEEMADYIEETFNAFHRGRPIWIEREGIQNFDRKMLAKRLNDVWQDVLAERW